MGDAENLVLFQNRHAVILRRGSLLESGQLCEKTPASRLGVFLIAV